MKKNPSSKHHWPLETLLAVLQQAEYDWRLVTAWRQAPREELDLILHLEGLRPEKNTLRLRITRRIAQGLSILLPTHLALFLANRIVTPLQNLATYWVVWRAQRKLRAYQKRGLQIIAIAGSYGKTSTKLSLAHILSQNAFCWSTPASYNTPLGIASSVLHHLRPDHQYALIELGEYQVGDLAKLLHFIQPDVGVVTPIGFAHSERLSAGESVGTIFHDFFTSKFRPKNIFCHDQNSTIVKETSTTKNDIHWYGRQAKSTAQLLESSLKTSLSETSGTLVLSGEKHSVKTSLFGAHELENCLPGLALSQHFALPLEPALRCLSYHPPSSRRLEKHWHPQGVLVVDNSYNTNPGSWQSMLPLLSLTETPRAVVTAGFVELDEKTQSSAHQQLAQDLLKNCQVIGILRTRFNQELITTLQAQKTIPIVVGITQEEVLSQITALKRPLRTIWLEGGCRELYQ